MSALSRRSRFQDDFLDDYDARNRAELAQVTNTATEAVVEALQRVAQGGTAVVIQNLNVSVNYASGGGATVTVN